ncbi:hypothetical protein [Bacteroides faecis]|uniref:hypothetical protein n=1 Tax=Bacteroides faecis TaxID=674529 RepID=UPI0021641A3D|nr:MULTISPECIES: hypothetical protein [Bacteroides]MCS2933744.1 hypothetical protein [Bacteroides faecis]MCS2936511.1 hypothetical protein [Bacteroides faecis]MCS3210744.1 hypothetical protein [Bacteroides thetaiotaomicron]MCS3212738.1 hypothetical protein [Bacteroides thetaiotaomicron]UVS47082.1 hypothetical protein NXW99_17325 [Bacteroides faecis]
MNNLNKYTKIALWVIVVIILLGVAGRCDRNEQVVYNMPDDVYRTIKAELGDPSDDRIAEEYLNNRDYWTVLTSKGYGTGKTD